MPIPARAVRAWSSLRRRAAGSSAFDLLARTFLDRFFDNEITGRSGDLRSSFFWLLAFLAAPGLFMPIMRWFDWEFYVLRHGPEALRIATRGDKAFYLAFAMIASGALSVVVWNSLLLDRRDSLVLGPLPVRGATIVRAKLTAVAVYILIVAVAMHVMASAAFGLSLATHNTLSMAIAGIIAHLVASGGISAFTFLVVTAIQGVLFATVGARGFRTFSAVLQVAIVSALLLGLVFLPAFNLSVVDTLAGSGRRVAPWLLATPPLWFLGVYEFILGTDDPVLLRLTSLAAGGLAIGVVITLVTYPLAYRRLMSTAVELRDPGARAGVADSMGRWFALAAGGRAETRAAVQFMTASIARVSRHRFVLSGALGAAVALSLPTLFRTLPQLTNPPASPPAELLALPVQTMLILLVGLRIAIALPANLQAGWVLGGIGAPAPPLRAGVWRAMFLVAVAPVTFATAPFYAAAWGATIAAAHALLCLVVGAVLIEALLWGVDQMPCARPWRPEHANLRKWWPAYIAGFFAIAAGLPALEVFCLSNGPHFTGLVFGLAAIGLTLRLTHRRRRIMPEDADLDEPVPVQILNLD
jgi:hypothetical protein